MRLLFLISLALLIWITSISNELRIEAHAEQVIVGTLTAYSPSVDETDDTPRIAANGREVFEGGLANNCLKFGTMVEINGSVFVVNDRKNSRYGCEWFDLFLDSKEEARQFGIWKNQLIRIL